MSNYSPNYPFNVPMLLFVPTYEKVKGVNKKVYPEDGELFFGSFKTYGGTDTTKDGILSVVDTASIETWYRPDIKSDCLIRLAETGDTYEILGKPENINMRNQFIKLKVQGISGGA